MLLVLYRDLKKRTSSGSATPNKKKAPHQTKKKDALNINSTHPIISKLLEFYFLKKSFTASLATIRSSNT